MGNNRVEKEKSGLIDITRIPPLDDVKYIQEIFSWYLAMGQFDYIKENDTESEWDKEVSNAFKSIYSFLQSAIEEYSSLLAIKEKGSDISTINFKNFEETIKEINHNQDFTFNKDPVTYKYRKLLMSRMALIFHIFIDSSLSNRDKEIVILRSAWLCRSEYIWDHHTHSAKEAGLSNEEIIQIKNGINNNEMDSFTANLISSADELYTDAILSEETWNSLTQRYDMFQLMDLVFTIGFYMQLATALNTFKIQTENIVKDNIKNEGLPSFKKENNKVIPARKIGNPEPFRLEKPRITTLNEVEYIKESLMFQHALNRLVYTKNEEDETEWESEIDSLIQWLKNYNTPEIDGLSSFLKLDEKGLDINSINLEDFEDSIKSFMKQEGVIFNLKATMMKYRKLRLDWVIQAKHTTYDSPLPPRDKEILILRIAWLCRAQYEWDHHVVGGRRAGLTDEEFRRLGEGSDTKRLAPFDEILIQSADELYRDTTISNSTWKALSERYNTFQLMDLVFTVTSYNLLAMFLNSFGIQTEDCVKDLIK